MDGELTVCRLARADVDLNYDRNVVRIPCNNRPLENHTSRGLAVCRAACWVRPCWVKTGPMEKCRNMANQNTQMGTEGNCASGNRVRPQCLVTYARTLEKIVTREASNLAATHGLSVRGLEILACALDGREWKSTDLALALSISVGSLSREVHKLVDRELLSRRRPTCDRRVVLLKLTEEGRRKGLEVSARMKEYENLLADGISSEDMDKVMRFIRRMQDNYDYRR